MKIIIPCNPISQQRHRSFIRGGIINSYDPQHKEKNDIKKYLSYQYQQLLDSPDKSIAIEASNLARAKSFQVYLCFHMPIPASMSNSKRNAFLWGLDSNTTKPDLDNLAKFYLDCANGILYPDDAKISKLYLKKLYSNNPKTVMFIFNNDTNMTHDTVRNILEMMPPDDFLLLSEKLYRTSQKIQAMHEGNFSFDPNDDYPSELTEAALFLSEISHYAPLLAKINKKYGTFHEEYPKTLQRKENFYDTSRT